MSKGLLIITGANGFIGTNLIHEAKKQNWEVRGIVRRQESAEYIAELGAEPIIIKTLNENAFKHAFYDCKAVVHLIGVINEKETTFQEAHVESTKIVLRSAESQGLERVINISGLGVDLYGKVHWANNPYFGSKRDAELLLTQYSTPFVNFRPSYIFGPESYWFASLFRGINRGKINIIGDGSIPMQPIYVKDVVNCFLAAAEGKGENNVNYDMVGPEVTNMKNIIHRVIRFYNNIHNTRKSVEIVEIPYLDASTRLKISQEQVAIAQCDLLGDNSLLKARLGVELTALNEAIPNTIKNFSLI
jgi:nucleoside-diphosphate-sugar epimerase